LKSHKEIRFAFGKNWTQFLQRLDEERIVEAEKSLKEMLKVSDFQGLTFLDIGSGSGLFSLAARRMGATVTSFDYDLDSVQCTQHLKFTFFNNDPKWHVSQGSVLDPDFMNKLGTFDIVYSWGVLHHTGQMWTALEQAAQRVKPAGGRLFIAIYNDQGWRSRAWWLIKKGYCQGGFTKALVCMTGYPLQFLKTLVKSALTRKNEFALYKRSRGMSIWHDYVDWIGGFPFEVASVNAIQNFYSVKGFSVINLKTTQSLGNNEFVFVKHA
jgi:2-polyprenyl-6-hydroxyphenyl methylase/3-demethylubiquinone-9 3-methyltransferase